jgi:hypothetical protein
MLNVIVSKRRSKRPLYTVLSRPGNAVYDTILMLARRNARVSSRDYRRETCAILAP